jgi:hypothetical protein
LAIPVIGLAGAVMFGLTTRSPESAPTTVSGTVALPTPDAGSAAAADLTDDWRPVPLPGLGELHSGFLVDGGLIALGAIDGQSFLWRLEEEGRWSYLGSIPNADMAAGIEWGGMLLTVGSLAGVPTVWTSDRGQEWTPVALPVDVGSTGGKVNGVVTAGGGLVAFGAMGILTATDGVQDVAAVWRSVDGTNWRVASLGSSTPSVVDEVLVLPDRLVAAGRASGLSAIWTSADGAEWLHQDQVGAEYLGEFIDIAALPEGGFLALGFQFEAYSDFPGGSIWRSDDLTNWELVDPDFIMGIPFTSLEPTADEVWGLRLGPFFWFTRDGEAWQVINQTAGSGEAAAEAAARFPVVRDVVETEQGLVALGTEIYQPMAWIHGAGSNPTISAGETEPVWRPRTVLADSTEFYAVVGQTTQGLVAWVGGKIWLSDDGIAWNPVEELGSGSSGPGISGFGEWTGGRMAWGTTRLFNEPVLWTSEEGWDWERIDLGNQPGEVAWAGNWKGSLLAAVGNWNVGTIDWLELERSADGWRQSLVGSAPLVWGITPFGEGFVASRDETLDTPPQVVVSDDGLTWEAVFDGYLVGSIGSGLVANVIDGDYAFFSVDGRKWSASPVPGAAAAVSLAGDRGAVQATSGGEYTVWVTEDGSHWETIPAGITSGYSAVNMVLIPGTEQLLAFGHNHGRLAVWEYTG